MHAVRSVCGTPYGAKRTRRVIGGAFARVMRMMGSTSAPLCLRNCRTFTALCRAREEPLPLLGMTPVKVSPCPGRSASHTLSAAFMPRVNFWDFAANRTELGCSAETGADAEPFTRTVICVELRPREFTAVIVYSVLSCTEVGVPLRIPALRSRVSPFGSTGSTENSAEPPRLTATSTSEGVLRSKVK